ncbi:translation initiation factor 3 subunit K [Pelomyxa schiedti]|nr:translation initiation factor 3 subunit K [Pelomyxa schiedti]
MATTATTSTTELPRSSFDAAFFEKCEIADPDVLATPGAFLTMLEQYLQTNYKFDVATMLLKVYSFHPELLKRELVLKVLANALMRIPQPDFSCCLGILPRKMTDKSVSVLQYLYDLLETAKFEEFWRAAAIDAEELKRIAVPDFLPALRKYIYGVITLTYKRIEKDRLSAMLHITTPEEFLEASKIHSWVVTGDHVVFPRDTAAKILAEMNQASVTQPTASTSTSKINKPEPDMVQQITSQILLSLH